jgi:periplasmic protein TonB
MSDVSLKLQRTTKPAAEPVGAADHYIGRFASPVRESLLKNFIANVKDFLTERPVKVQGGGPSAFSEPAFGAGFGDNVKEFFQPGPRGDVNSDLLVNWNVGLGSFWQNLRDIIAPPKLPPLQVSSKPVAVKDIWTKDTQFTRVQALSIAAHVVVLVLIIVPLLPALMSPPTTQAKTYTVTQLDSPFLPKLPPGPKKAGGGGGGGEHNVLPASKGQLPKFSWTQFTPPKVKTPENARLQMTPTVLGPPELKLPSPQTGNWGDPLGKVINDSSGTGSGNGIGSGSGTGVGSGNGGGVGPGNEWGTGGGYPSAGTGGYGIPGCLYCPNPQFSDDAVKAKYQGTVLLMAVITADGRATNIRVAKGLGMGLDEKAIEAVRTWRFRPAVGPDGKAAAVSTPIEVVFRLY